MDSVLSVCLTVALEIKKACDTRKANREECKKISSRVNFICVILQKLPTPLPDSLLEQLQDFSNVLQSAKELVVETEDNKRLKRVLKKLKEYVHADSDSIQFNELQSRLTYLVGDFNLALSAYGLGNKDSSDFAESAILDASKSGSTVAGGFEIKSPCMLSSKQVAYFRSIGKDGGRKQKSIGTGYFSNVYEAKLYGENVAVKTMVKQSYESEKQLIVRTNKEASIIMKLRHPSIIRIIALSDTINDEKEKLSPFIIFELIPHNLKHIIHVQPDFLVEKEMLEVLTQVAEAVHYLHNCNPRIEHRNLKPDNIMISREKVLLFFFHLCSCTLVISVLVYYDGSSYNSYIFCFAIHISLILFYTTFLDTNAFISIFHFLVNTSTPS